MNNIKDTLSGLGLYDTDKHNYLTDTVNYVAEKLKKQKIEETQGKKVRLVIHDCPYLGPYYKVSIGFKSKDENFPEEEYITKQCDEETATKLAYLYENKKQKELSLILDDLEPEKYELTWCAIKFIDELGVIHPVSRILDED